MPKSQAKKLTPAKKTIAEAGNKRSTKPVKKSGSTKKPAAKLVKNSTPTRKTSPILTKKVTAKPIAKVSSMSTKKAPSKTPAKPIAKAPVKASPVKESASKATKIKRDYKPAKLPDGYKPTVNEPYMNPQQEEYFRQKLLTWRNELMTESRETLDHLHEENWHQADIADRASLETEAGVELRTRNRYLKLISKIDAAIRRIEEGDYGYCEETGEPIGLKRLEARPVATLSIEAQERHEKIEKQYTDED